MASEETIAALTAALEAMKNRKEEQHKEDKKQHEDIQWRKK